MSATRIAAVVLLSISLAGGAVAQSKGKGKGGGGGGGEDPPAEFVPAIAYVYESNKYEDVRIANVEGDQSCLVARFYKGEPAGQLREISFNTRTKRFAFSRNDGLYVTTWSDTPCQVDQNFSMIVNAADLAPYDGNTRIDGLDFSPSGRELVWSFNPTVNDGKRDLIFYDFDAAPSERVERLRTEYFIFQPRFSPHYDSTREIFVVANKPDGPFTARSLYALQRADASGRFVTTLPNVDASMAVSTPNPNLAIRISLADNDAGAVYQFDDQGTSLAAPIQGAEAELAFSCDNSQLIHMLAVNWRNQDTYMTSADGTSSQLWSSAHYKQFDWLCP